MQDTFFYASECVMEEEEEEGEWLTWQGLTSSYLVKTDSGVKAFTAAHA